MNNANDRGRGDDAIAQFWSWFQASRGDVAELCTDAPDRELIDEVSHRVSSLHDGLGWEVGPGNETEYQFVISPNRNRERLLVSRAIVRQAPDLPEWKFFHAKPPKSWNMELEILDGDRRVRASCRHWQYRLTAFDGGAFFDIDFYPVPLEPFSKNTYQKLGVLLVEGEIGEELFIERVDRVNVHSDTGELPADGLTPAVHLYQHLLDALKNKPTTP